MNLFCVDVGTSSIKAGIVGTSGKLVSYARIPFPSSAPGDFRAEYWIDALGEAVARTRAFQADGVVVSGQGPSLVALDSFGRPLFPVLAWNDGRSVRLNDDPSFFLPKLAWLRDNRPDIHESARLFLSCPEYLSYALTGEPFMFTPSEEFEKHIWAEDSLARYGLDPAALPPFLTTGGSAGRVTAHGTSLSGLKTGMPVFAGGSDFLMALLGTAVTRPGLVCDRAGTSEGINYCSRMPVSGDRIRCLPHAVEGLYNIAGILSSTGRLFEWFRSISGQTERPYDEMLQEIRMAFPESSTPVFFPTLHEGASWEFARGIFFDLGAAHGKADMGRAVVESIGFAVREALEILSSHVGEIGELRVTGGQAKNPVWNQMKADITGVRILVPEIEDAELTGDACAGLVGAGVRGSLSEAADALFRVKRTYDPHPGNLERYTDRYRKYLELYAEIRSALKY